MSDQARDTSEKLEILVPVRLTRTAHGDLVKVCGGLRRRAGWIRDRIEEAIQKAKEEKRLKVTREEAQVVAEVNRLAGRGAAVEILRNAIPALAGSKVSQ